LELQVVICEYSFWPRCAAVFPLALICGEIRGIPLYWRLIDCSFGLFGAIPLLYCLKLVREMSLARE
jgi:hypothetical protein